MAQLFVAWRLEAGDPKTSRVETGCDVLDGAVLAGGVHALKDDEHGPASVGPEHVLQAGDVARATRDHVGRLVLEDVLIEIAEFVGEAPARVPVAEADLRAGLHAEALDRQRVDDLVAEGDALPRPAGRRVQPLDAAAEFGDSRPASEKSLLAARQIGRAQIGIGDARYQNDAVARVQFRDALEREVQLASQGGAGGSAQRYAQRVRASLESARAVEDRLVAQFAELERQVAARIGEVQGKVEAERVKINGYNMTLGQYDAEAHDLVGQVAKRNFVFVRDKLRNIVLRADVGITEQAWEVREEELDRVHNLQTERAREEQLLDEELREVLDDTGEGPAKK